MTNFLIAVAMICAAPARAQMSPDEAAFVAAGSQEVIGAGVVSPAPAPSLDWLKIGGTFGPSQDWQFGADKSIAGDACGVYARKHHASMAGPCRDVFLLARKAVPAFTLGGAFYTRPQGHPVYGGSLGFNVGPGLASFLGFVGDHIPYFETLASWKAPVWAAYVGKITSFGYQVLIIDRKEDDGPGMKVKIPVSDLKALLPSQ